MNDPAATSAATLSSAVALGRAAGLNHVYAGNLPGQVDGAEDTCCSRCGGLLIKRRGYNITAIRLAGSSCPDCQAPVPGVWDLPPAR